jgi:hypothetical protein
MERHAALPYREDLERVREVVAGLVEEHVAEPPTDDDAEHAPEQQVVDIGPYPASRREVRLLHAQRCKPQEEDERNEVSQPVPVDLDRPQREGDRVELRVHEHGRR